MKAVWISAVGVAPQEVRAVMQKLRAYGLAAAGHEWQDDNARMAWLAAKEELCNPNCALWAIMGSKEALQKPESRYGLSLLALSVQARRGLGFPIVVLQTDAHALSAEALPTPLQRAMSFPAADAGTPAKLVAKAHAKVPDLPAAYHMEMVGSAHLGQWFELRPTRDAWQGIIFGVDQGDITFQAVGPAGSLPDKTTLNFPMQGLKLTLKDKTYTAWAVRNAISPQTAYYVKVDQFPNSLIFGSFSEEAQTEMYRLYLT